MPTVRSRRTRGGLLIAPVLIATSLLAGCTGLTTPTGAPTTPLGSGTPTLGPGEEVIPTGDPTLRPDGSAEQNAQYFAKAAADFQAAHGRGDDPQQVVDAFAAAGFDRSAMEVTKAITPNHYQTAQITVAVRIGDDCLIATLRKERVTTSVQAALPTGVCLLGELYDFQ